MVMCYNDYIEKGVRMKTYIAGPYNHQADYRAIAKRMAAADLEVISRWIMAPEKLSDVGWAFRDKHDIFDCDLLILDLSDDTNPGKGRYVEFGIAIATSKQIIIIGDNPDNIFLKNPYYSHFDSWDAFWVVMEGK